jgi:hypothetical protein
MSFPRNVVYCVWTKPALAERLSKVAPDMVEEFKGTWISQEVNPVLGGERRLKIFKVMLVREWIREFHGFREWFAGEEMSLAFFDRYWEVQWEQAESLEPLEQDCTAAGLHDFKSDGDADVEEFLAWLRRERK